MYIRRKRREKIFEERYGTLTPNLIDLRDTLVAHNCCRVAMESDKAFSTIAAPVRIHLISHLDLKWVVTEGRRTYPKRAKSRNKSPTVYCMSLFD